MGVDSWSEFNGDGVMPNTVFPKGSEALTPADKLRLQSLTGQEVDSRAIVDPYHWYGNVGPNEEGERQLARQRQQQTRLKNRLEANRYKQT